MVDDDEIKDLVIDEYLYDEYLYDEDEEIANHKINKNERKNDLKGTLLRKPIQISFVFKNLWSY